MYLMIYLNKKRKKFLLEDIEIAIKNEMKLYELNFKKIAFLEEQAKLAGS